MLSRVVLIFLRMLLFLGLTAIPAQRTVLGQDSGTSQALRINSAQNALIQTAINLIVYVRESSGLAMEQPAQIRLHCLAFGANSMDASSQASKAQFLNVPAGDCDLEISARGFRQTKQKVTVNDLLLAKNQQVFVYMFRESEPVSSSLRPEITPGLLEEMDKAAAARGKKKVDEAWKHLNKALRMAPSNPDALYLSGTLYLDQNKFAEAEQQYQKAVVAYPSHERSLLALSETQISLKEYEAASKTAEQLLRQNPASWRGHFFAGTAYSQMGNYAKAQEHAEQAIKLSNSEAAPSIVLYAQILAAKGDLPTARKEYEIALSRFPNDPVAPLARESLANLDKAEAARNASSFSRKMIAAASTTSQVVWMPPEVDRMQPAVSADVVCTDADVLKRAAAATKKQFESFERFTATEHIEHQEIDGKGIASRTRIRDFNYLVFVEQYPNSKQLYLNENRDGGVGVDAFPTFLATVGLVGLGVNVFQPMFTPALDFHCEGLGQWRSQPTWIVYFKQKSGVRSSLRLWRTATDTYEEPIKGRVWLSTNTFELLHMETDLAEPIKKLGLTRDHIGIDYGPVQFKKGSAEMWLPWSAEIFLDLNNHHYHHRHTLSNYAMFGVDTNNKINNPRNAPPEDPETNSGKGGVEKPN